MRDVPATIPATDPFISRIPLLDENFDQEDDFIEGHVIPEPDTDSHVPTTLKVRGYL